MSDPEIERIMKQKMQKMIADAARPDFEGVADLDTASFDAHVASDTPVIVDFWAEWCGPCKSMHGIVDSLAVEFARKVRFARVNIDACAPIAQRLGVQSIPTFIAFSKGREVTRVVGAVGAQRLRDIAQKL